MNWIIYGSNGWIGSQFCEYLKVKYPEINIIVPSSRADDIDGVTRDLDKYFPDRVICFIGRTSGPGCNSIDYLEGPGKLVDNIRDNLFAPLILMKLCQDRGIHCTYLGTGCIFAYDDPNDPPFTENSKPNFTGSSYSTVKGFTDQLSFLFPNTLNVRIRMPISSYDHPRSLLSKIIRYPKICNTLNSISVLDDIIPALIKQIRESRTGTINLVNPEGIDHVTILELYKKYVDPTHTYTLVSETEQDVKVKRAKNVMTASIQLPLSKDSIENILREFKKTY